MRSELNLFKRASRLQLQFHVDLFKWEDDFDTNEEQASAWECCLELAKEEQLENTCIPATEGVFILGDNFKGCFTDKDKDYPIKDHNQFKYDKTSKEYSYKYKGIYIIIKDKWMLEKLALLVVKTSPKVKSVSKHKKAIAFILDNCWTVGSAVRAVADRFGLDYSFILSPKKSIRKVVIWDKIVARRACCNV